MRTIPPQLQLTPTLAAQFLTGQPTPMAELDNPNPTPTTPTTPTPTSPTSLTFDLPPSDYKDIASAMAFRGYERMSRLAGRLGVSRASLHYYTELGMFHTVKIKGSRWLKPKAGVTLIPSPTSSSLSSLAAALSSHSSNTPSSPSSPSSNNAPAHDPNLEMTICPQCNDAFPSMPGQRLCSFACRTAARRNDPHSYYEAHVIKHPDPSACWGWKLPLDASLSDQAQPSTTNTLSATSKPASPAQEIRGLRFIAGGKKYTSRWIYEHNTGTKLQPDQTLYRTCANVLCTNPFHVELVTRAENARRNWVRRNQENLEKEKSAQK